MLNIALELLNIINLKPYYTFDSCKTRHSIKKYKSGKYTIYIITTWFSTLYTHKNPKLLGDPMSTPPQKYIKVAFIGDSGVGKTSLIKAFIGEDIANVKSTVGIDNYTLKKEGLNVIIWDFAGQKWFLEILIDFLKGAKIIVLVFDLSEPRTLMNIVRYWVPNIHKHADKDAFIILVGNKKDIKTISDDVLIKFVDDLKQKIKIQLFLQTSAKLKENVSRLFEAIFEIVKMNEKIRENKKA